MHRGQGGGRLHFCLVANDGAYDNIDRSDEDIAQLDYSGRPNIKYAALKQCNDTNINNFDHGVICDRHCLGVT